MKTYEEMFADRGGCYDEAMLLYPSARDEEFLQVINKAEIRPGMRVADVPAGGGYLGKYLGRGVEWLPFEVAKGFRKDGVDDLFRQLIPLPWSDAYVDVLLSIAGLHHISKKETVFSEFHRVVKQGGGLVISDVYAESDVALFLDDYVGRYNTTGHEGIWLDGHTTEKLESCGWIPLSSSIERYHWQFDSEFAMVDFCHKLFDINKASYEQTLNAISSYLGIEQLPNGLLGMNWSLMTVSAVKP